MGNALPPFPVVDKPVEVYSDGRISVLHGDCRGLPADAAFDHVICDPPYDTKTHKRARYGFRETSSEIPFDPVDPSWVAPLLLRLSAGWCVAFCSMEMLGAYRDASGDAWVRSGFWRRTNGVPQFSGDRPGQPGEGIAIMHNPGEKRWNGKGAHAFFEYPIVCGGPHPTTKPLKLMQEIILLFTNPDDLIVDPFMGSGTTLLAAKNTGRRAVGVDLNSDYCDMAIGRLRQGVLF